MKKIILLSAFAAPFMWSCGTEKKEPAADSLKKDSVIVRNSFILEDLLDISDEKELRTRFGTDAVTYDTIWGAEGSFGYGTYINKGTADEVQIFWKDSASRSGVGGVSIFAYAGNDLSRTYSNKWSSETGVKLGMDAAQLETLNDRPFSFYGIGWDYGGGVTDWNGGKLNTAGIGLSLDGDYGASSSDDLSAVSGDHVLVSSDPAVRKVKLRVVAISVYKPEK